MARSLSILTCNACRGKSCEKKLKKLSSLAPPSSAALDRARTHRWPTDFAKIRGASRGAHARMEGGAPLACAECPSAPPASWLAGPSAVCRAHRGQERAEQRLSVPEPTRLAAAPATQSPESAGLGCDVATSRTSDGPWGVGGDPCARRGHTDVRRRSRKVCRTHKKVRSRTHAIPVLSRVRVSDPYVLYVFASQRPYVDPKTR